MPSNSLSQFTNILQSMIDLNYSYPTQPPGITRTGTNSFFPNETHIPQENEDNEDIENEEVEMTVSDNSDIYQEQLETLESAGFIDNTTNILTLNLTNGDVNEALLICYKKI